MITRRLDSMYSKICLALSMGLGPSLSGDVQASCKKNMSKHTCADLVPLRMKWTGSSCWIGGVVVSRSRMSCASWCHLEWSGPAGCCEKMVTCHVHVEECFLLCFRHREDLNNERKVVAASPQIETLALSNLHRLPYCLDHRGTSTIHP